MADNFYSKYSGVGGGGGGVTSVNTLTGALTLVGSGGTTVTSAGSTITVSSTPGITALTGDVSASGSGSVAASITATTNNTITTLSALSLPFTQITGVPAFANPQLSNLSSTAINVDLLPGVSSAVNLGSPSLQFSNLSLNTLGLYYPGQSTPYGSLSIDANNFAQVILQSLVPRTEVQLLTAANAGGNSGAIRLNTGNASSFSGDIDFVTGTANTTSGNFNFTTGTPGANYNSGGFLFQAGAVSGTGVQGAFTVDASAFSVMTSGANGLLIDSNGAATFQSTGEGVLFNGPGENTLITTQNSTIGTAGNTTISSGTVGPNVYMFLGLSMTANPGDTYSNNGFTYTVIQIPFGTILYAYGNGVPQAAGTLTRVTGTGTASVPYTSATQNAISSGNTYITTGSSGAYANTGNVVIQPGTAGSGGVQGDVQILGPKLDLSGTNVLQLASTVTPSGTDGAQTINKASGTVNFAAGASSLVVTNNLVTANSIVFAVVRTNDATAMIHNVVPTSGSFTINLLSAATAETSVGFLVINQ